MRGPLNGRFLRLFSLARKRGVSSSPNCTGLRPRQQSNPLPASENTCALANEIFVRNRDNTSHPLGVDRRQGSRSGRRHQGVWIGTGQLLAIRRFSLGRGITADLSLEDRLTADLSLEDRQWLRRRCYQPPPIICSTLQPSHAQNPRTS
jgi:hypothetical protein